MLVSSPSHTYSPHNSSPGLFGCCSFEAAGAVGVTNAADTTTGASPRNAYSESVLVSPLATSNHNIR